jgi:hypothetical protein
MPKQSSRTSVIWATRHEHSLGEGCYRLRMDGVVGSVDIKRPYGWLRRKRNIEVRNRWLSIPDGIV